MRKKERHKEKKEPGKEARERKLTIPPSFFSNVNFIATSQRFTDKFVPAPDSECRLSGLLRPDEATSKKTEIRQDTRRRRQSKRSRLPSTLLSRVYILFLCSHPDVSSPSSSTFLLPLLDYPTYRRRISRPFILHHFFFRRASPCETRGPATPFLRFSHFNATSVRLRDDTYYTPRPHDNTVDNGNDGCTSLFMPPLPQPTPAYLLLVCRSAAARPNFPASSFSRSYFRDVRRMLAQTLSDLRQRMRV